MVSPDGHGGWGAARLGPLLREQEGTQGLVHPDNIRDGRVFVARVRE